jgi:hypothetical protein
MMEAIHSIPTKCSRCESKNLWGADEVSFGYDDSIRCNACGHIMVVVDWVDPTELEGEDFGIPPVDDCPHCHSVDTIMVFGDQEVCQSCHLDPTVLDYASPEIAHLWKEGSSMRRWLTNGRARAGAPLGTFFRNFCGPHCAYAEDCDQDAAQMKICFKELKPEVLAIISPHLPQPEDDMSKRSKRRKKKEKSKENMRSLFICAPKGWFKKYMRESDETICEERSASEGSG